MLVARPWLPIAVVWSLFAAVGLAILVTYSRLEPEQLYNVSNEGLAGGASRLLVFLNYPVSLAAIAISWLAAERIGTRGARWAAGVATALCAVTAWPGVIDQHDLDAKLVNLVPAVGVVIAFVLSLRAPWEPVGRLRLDPLRVAIAVAVWLVALVWIAATLGFFFPGDFLLGEEIRRGGGGHLAPAVHLGEHEGLDAALLITSVLVLTRYRPRLAVMLLLSLGFVYGVFVEWRDFWFEQINKRDWLSWKPPSVLTPHVSFAWGLLLVLAVVVALVVRRLEGPSPPAGDPRRRAPAPGLGPPPEESRTGGQSP
jgi:uncharacterized membrane protein